MAKSKEPLHDLTVHNSTRKADRKMTYKTNGSASDAIGDVKKGCEIFGLTNGQYSFIDVIEHVLSYTGEADIVISTWTAADADIKKIVNFMAEKKFRSIKFIVDNYFLSRMPELCELIINNFGDCIRTTKTHAKFCTIKNDEWNIVLRTSMNLNSNPRIENFEISDDLKFWKFFDKFVTQCFDKLPLPNIKNKKGNYQTLPGFDDDKAEELKGDLQIDLTHAQKMFKIKEREAQIELEMKEQRLEQEKIKTNNLKKINDGDFSF